MSFPIKEGSERGNVNPPPATPKPADATPSQSSCEKKVVCCEKCATLSDDKASRNAKLEAVERQLYHLIGQIRALKTA